MKCGERTLDSKSGTVSLGGGNEQIRAAHAGLKSALRASNKISCGCYNSQADPATHQPAPNANQKSWRKI
jgi:hypothetical protein